MNTTTPNLSLSVQTATAPDAIFTVWKLKGREAISEPFSFDLELVSDGNDRSLAVLLYRPATLTMTRLVDTGGILTEVPIVRHGILADIRLVGRDTALRWRYQARLVPQLWKLSLTQRSQVFTATGQTIKDIILQVIDQALTSSGRTDAIASVPAFVGRDMVMQYQESDLAFVSRWLEHEGIHYTFDHSGSSDKVVLCNTNQFATVAQLDPLTFTEHGDTTASSGQVIYDGRVLSLILCQRLIPKQVALQGYDWLTPATFISSTCDVDPGPAPTRRGVGTHAEYNSHFTTQAEGDRLAGIRAQEFFCREAVYAGTACSPFMSAGHTVAIAGHYNSDLNRRYLLTEVTHYAEQLADGALQDGCSWTYRNEFVALQAEPVFRPERRTPWPAIRGVINGKIHDPIDASTNLETAPVDQYGRYLVRLPFADASGALGQDTCRIRMAQPYAGADFGMHFPLHDGTEVTLVFLDGDPDRPVISGALFDAAHLDPVTEHNATQGGIKTSSGSAIGFEDTGQNSKVSISAGSGGAAITIGTLGKSHTGPLTLDNVQIAALMLDVTAGAMSSHVSPMITNSGAYKWGADVSYLNLLFMIPSLVSKSGNDGKDPILGIAVQPGDQARIDVFNELMVSLWFAFAKFLFFKFAIVRNKYHTELAVTTQVTSRLRKVLNVVKKVTMFLLNLPRGGGDRIGICLLIAPHGLLSRMEASGAGKNIWISTAAGSLLMDTKEDITAIAQGEMHLTAPDIHLMQSAGTGGLTLDEDLLDVQHQKQVIIVAGSGPAPPLKSDLTLKPASASLGSNKVLLDGFEEVRFVAGPLAKLAKMSLQGTGTIELEGMVKVTVKSDGEIALDAGAGQAKVAMGPTGIKLSYGASSIELGPAGITIKSAALVKVQGTTVDIKGDALAELKGAIVNVKPDGVANLG